MNISAAGTGSGWFTSATKGASAWNSTETYVGEGLAGPGPQSSKNLTTADRDTIKATTGIEIRDNGEILMPMAMNAVDFGTAIFGISQLANSRSRGQSDELSGSDFLQVLAKHGYSNSAHLNLNDYAGIDLRG